jgi:hypothetical protein
VDFVDGADLKPVALRRQPQQGVQRMGVAARQSRASGDPGGVASGDDVLGEVARGLAQEFQAGQRRRASVYLPLALALLTTTPGRLVFGSMIHLMLFESF